jgi:hypothetical protein
LSDAELGLSSTLYRHHVPVSPRWLIVHGDTHAAEKIISDIEAAVTDHPQNLQARGRHRTAAAEAHPLGRDLESHGARAPAAILSWIHLDGDAGVLL